MKHERFGKIYQPFFFCVILLHICVVPRRGIEPPRDKSHTALNRACLPVPAPGHVAKLYIR